MFQKEKKRKQIDIFKNVPNFMDLILPDEIQEKKDYLKLGYNKYSRIFVMTIFPEQTWIGWLNELIFIGNVNISVKVEPADSSNICNQLSRKISQARSEYSIYSNQGNILHIPELEKQIIDLEGLRALIQTNQDKLFFATIFITLNAESKEELTDKTKKIESTLNKKSAMVRALTFRQVEGLKTMLPTGDIPIPNFERNMISERYININTNFKCKCIT